MAAARTAGSAPTPVERDDAFARLEQVAVANAKGKAAERGGTRSTCTDARQRSSSGRPSGSGAVGTSGSMAHQVTCGNVSLWRSSACDALAFTETGRPARPHLEHALQAPGRWGPAPAASELKPGDLVQIRPKREIAETLDAKGKCRDCGSTGRCPVPRRDPHGQAQGGAVRERAHRRHGRAEERLLHPRRRRLQERRQRRPLALPQGDLSVVAGSVARPGGRRGCRRRATRKRSPASGRAGSDASGSGEEQPGADDRAPCGACVTQCVESGK